MFKKFKNSKIVRVCWMLEEQLKNLNKVLIKWTLFKISNIFWIWRTKFCTRTLCLREKVKFVWNIWTFFKSPEQNLKCVNKFLKWEHFMKLTNKNFKHEHFLKKCKQNLKRNIYWNSRTKIEKTNIFLNLRTNFAKLWNCEKNIKKKRETKFEDENIFLTLNNFWKAWTFFQVRNKNWKWEHFVKFWTIFLKGWTKFENENILWSFEQFFESMNKIWKMRTFCEVLNTCEQHKKIEKLII